MAVPVNSHGKARSFGRGLFFIVITLGIYQLYWHYKAYKEIEEAHPADVDYPLALYLLSYVPIIGLIGQVLYMSSFIDDVNKIRHKYQLPEGTTLGSFLAWYVLGSLILVGPFVAYYQLQSSINDIWRQVQRVDAQQASQAPQNAQAAAPGSHGPADPGQTLASPGDTGRSPDDGDRPPMAPESNKDPVSGPQGSSVSGRDPTNSESPPDRKPPLSERSEVGQGDDQPEHQEPHQRGPEPDNLDTTPSSEPEPSGDESGSRPETSSDLESDPEPVGTERLEANDPPAHYDPHACSECGEETEIPPDRPLRLTCPHCGTRQIIRNGN